MEVDKSLKDYIEKEIFPIYKKNDKGHQLDHIEYVINRSLRFAEEVENINIDMVYVIASFHDIAHHIDKDNHEKLSGEWFYNDEEMKNYFTDEERQTIKEAIEDHRASLKREPRSIYGKIVSTADRNTSINSIMERTHAYTMKHNKNLSLKEIIERAYTHINEKFGKNGYSKVYFEDKAYEAFKKEVEYLLDDKVEFVKRYIKVNAIINEEDYQDKYLRDNIFNENLDYYEKLIKLHSKKQELLRLKELCTLIKPFVIEFTGTPRTGKTTTINNIYDFFKKAGFDIKIIEELTTSRYYKEEIRKRLSKKSVGERNLDIVRLTHEQLLEAIDVGGDIILIDRSLNDRQIWNYIRYLKGDFDKETYEELREKYKEISQELIDLLVITYTDSGTALKRDYLSSLCLEKRNFLNKENIETYNNALNSLIDLFDESVEKSLRVDTTNTSIRDTSVEVAHQIQEELEKKYIKSNLL